MREERWNREEGEAGFGRGRGEGRGRRGPGGRGGFGPEGRFSARGGPEGPGSRRGRCAPAGPFGGPGLEAMFGSTPFGRDFGRGRRARRGDVRAAILDLLAEGQRWNGYQIIQEIAERTQGVWRPSAGSVYPALQQLEDEGLISPEGEGRGRLYGLTDEGRSYAEAHADELSRSWEAAQGMADDVAIELRDLIRQVTLAVMEVARAGTNTQLSQARQTLTETRRSLYRLLADGDVAGETPGGAAPTSDGNAEATDE
ncbi:MAG: PadR family transcriptional regulator [Streptosporangiaceae bacterium]